MSLNCNEINTILNELNLTGSFIQQIVQPGYDSLALYCYKNGTPVTVLICLAPGACRIHETRKKIPKNNKPLRFMEFLKSRIKGCRINGCEQIGLERIIKLELSNYMETFFMYIRLWSSASNIIITDEKSTILDVFFRRPKRGEVSGGTFTEPEIKDDKTEDAIEKYKVRTFEDLTPKDVNPTDVNSSSLTPNTLTFNQKVDLWYSEHAEILSREALLVQAEKLFNIRHSKMEAALQKLEIKRSSFLLADKWKHQGDLILTYGHLITGTQSYLDCTDYETGTEMRIIIDPKKRAQENASIYYEKYKKAISGLADLEHDIQQSKKELLDLETAYNAVCKEPNPIRMQQMIRYQNKPKQQIQKKHPGLSYSIDDWYILVGRTADENDELLRHHVKGADLWMHTRDWPGGYVFIKARPGKTIPLEILLDAGNLAVYHSKARKAQTADLYYTHVKYLRRAKNGPKGTVLPTQEKNLSITLDPERLRKLDQYQLES